MLQPSPPSQPYQAAASNPFSQMDREPVAEAPPKRVAMAMDRLTHASRVIADIRLSADRLLEALFVSAEPHLSNRSIQFIAKEEGFMRQHLQNLRNVGRQLEESGVLNESLRSRSNSWGLHMPLVCPDGAVVAYAWKRQLAGQAGASAVDRTRLALKAFRDHKRRFFPHLDNGLNSRSSVMEPASKRRFHLQPSVTPHQEKHVDCKTLLDILKYLEKHLPNIRIQTYERLDWLKTASLLLSCEKDNFTESSHGHAFHGSDQLGSGSLDSVPAEKVAVIELVFPSVFRVVVSLHPLGSVDPDAVAFFSPDEGGSYVHSRGLSVFNVFRHITEHATMALQYFLGVRSETALSSFLLWVCSYQDLFMKVCSKCGKLLSMDRQLALLLPPVRRPYIRFSGAELFSRSESKSLAEDSAFAFHIGCFSERT